MSRRGILRQIIPDSGEAIMVVRVPELLASEAAVILSNRLAADVRSDARNAAKALARAAESLPLGDIVAAQAIVDVAHRDGSLPLSVIMQLIELKPERHPVAAGARAAMYFPGIGAMDVTVDAAAFLNPRLFSGRGSQCSSSAKLTAEQCESI